MELLQEIRRLEEQHLRTDVRASETELATLLADEFLEFSSSGRVYDKKTAIDAVVSAGDTPSPTWSIEGFTLTPLGDDAVLTAYRCVKQSGPEQKGQCTLRSSVWRRIDGRWRMVFHQGTVASERT